VRRLVEELPSGETGRDPYDRANLLEHIADLIHSANVGQPLPTRGAGKNEIGVLGHPIEAEVNLAEQRAALQEDLIAKALPESPEDPGEIEVLLDELRLYPLTRGGLAAQIGEERPIR
jgi:hypothetical protein